MKLIYNPTRLAALVFVSLIMFGSCQKESSPDATSQEEFTSQASSEADAESDDIFNEVFDNVLGVNADVGFGGTGVFGQMNPGSSGGTARLTACPDVTVIHLSGNLDPFPVKIIMDFGTGCTGRDGRTRSGKIITVYTDRLFVFGATATTEFDNFTIDSIKVQGRHVILNQGEAISTSPTLCIRHKWKVTITNAKLSKPNGNYTEWNSTKTISQLEGTCTPWIHLDDIYKIEGGANGKVKRGDLLIAWNSEITTPLVKNFSCRWLVKGIIRIARINLTTNSPWVATINYGTGDCDNKAVVTINGVAHNITLP
ncbi:MAG TPA: hypothetical protein VHQ93_21360 [Chitinophagaceae bacterium]|jgi:hypothetical protein|nr:hypothetical protein [Chitinophagaceae bacterium]